MKIERLPSVFASGDMGVLVENGANMVANEL